MSVAPLLLATALLLSINARLQAQEPFAVLSQAAGRTQLSADRHSVLEPTFGPLSVLAALDFQSGSAPDVAVEGFAVVADSLDDVHNPVVRQADAGAEIALGSEQTANFRIGAG